MEPTLGSIFKEKREETKMSIRRAAEELNLSPTYLYNIENDRRKKPSTSNLYRLCELYNLDIEEIFRLAGYTFDEIEDFHTKLQINKILQKKIDQLGFQTNLNKKDVLDILFFNEKRIDDLDDMNFEIHEAKSIISKIDKILNDDKNKIYEKLNLTGYDEKKISLTYPHTKDSKGIDGKPTTLKSYGKLSENQLKQVNDLHTLLNYKNQIDILWKGQRLSENKINKLITIIDLFVNDNE